RTLEERGKAKELAELATWLPSPGKVVYTRQQQPLGLGHAVLCAKELVGDEPFAVFLPDDLILARTPVLQQMVEVFAETQGNVVAVMEVPRQHTKRYGVLDVAADDGRLVKVKGLVEKPEPSVAPSTLSIIGRYIPEPPIFAELERTGRGAGGEIQLTDGMLRLLAAGRPFHGLRFEGKRFDCGDKLGFLEAMVAHALARPDLGPAFRALLETY